MMEIENQIQTNPYFLTVTERLKNVEEDLRALRDFSISLDVKRKKTIKRLKKRVEALEQWMEE